MAGADDAYERDWHTDDNTTAATGPIPIDGGPDDAVFGSHVMHEIWSYFPMRSIRTPRWRLVHNLLASDAEGSTATFDTATDVLFSPTFEEIMGNVAADRPTGWHRSLDSYVRRPEFELYEHDDSGGGATAWRGDGRGLWRETTNLAYDPAYAGTLAGLKRRLDAWRMATHDLWGRNAALIMPAAPGGASTAANAAQQQRNKTKPSPYHRGSAAKKFKLVDVLVTGFAPAEKIRLIKAVRAVANLPLLEAKRFVEAAPKVLLEQVKEDEAEIIMAQLQAAGAEVELLELYEGF